VEELIQIISIREQRVYYRVSICSEKTECCQQCGNGCRQSLYYRVGLAEDIRFLPISVFENHNINVDGYYKIAFTNSFLLGKCFKVYGIPLLIILALVTSFEALGVTELWLLTVLAIGSFYMGFLNWFRDDNVKPDSVLVNYLSG